MSSTLNSEDACLILRRFLPNQASLVDSWLNDDIVMSMIRLLFLTSSNVDIVGSQTIEVGSTASNPTLLRYDPGAELMLLPCHCKDHWCLGLLEDSGSQSQSLMRGILWCRRRKLAFWA